MCPLLQVGALTYKDRLLIFYHHLVPFCTRNRQQLEEAADIKGLPHFMFTPRIPEVPIRGVAIQVSTKYENDLQVLLNFKVLLVKLIYTSI
jgi:hypothetical protein